MEVLVTDVFSLFQENLSNHRECPFQHLAEALFNSQGFAPISRSQ